MRSTTRSPRSERRHRGAAFAAINTDWESVRRSGSARRALREWRTGTHGDIFDGVVDLDDILDALAACDTPAESDRWLAPLVELAAGGDEVAARTVLQAMLPMADHLVPVPSRRGRRAVERDLGPRRADRPLPARRAPDEDRRASAVHVPPGAVAPATPLPRYRRARSKAPRRPQDDPDGSPSVVDVVAADSDGRSSFDQLTAAVVDVVSTGGLDADRASLVLAIAAGHRVGELAERAGCHHSVMSRRVSAATDTIAEAVHRDTPDRRERRSRANRDR